jgi:hypothetical protein
MLEYYKVGDSVYINTGERAGTIAQKYASLIRIHFVDIDEQTWDISDPRIAKPSHHLFHLDQPLPCGTEVYWNHPGSDIISGYVTSEYTHLCVIQWSTGVVSCNYKSDDRITRVCGGDI